MSDEKKNLLKDALHDKEGDLEIKIMISEKKKEIVNGIIDCLDNGSISEQGADKLTKFSSGVENVVYDYLMQHPDAQIVDAVKDLDTLEKIDSAKETAVAAAEEKESLPITKKDKKVQEKTQKFTTKRRSPFSRTKLNKTAQEIRKSEQKSPQEKSEQKKKNDMSL